jgi:periplasmic protein TonB
VVHLNKYKGYPAERSHMDAEIDVNLELDRSDRVLSASVAKGSGDPAFNAATVVQRASPVLPPPPLIADESLTFWLPVIFRANGKR